MSMLFGGGNSTPAPPPPPPPVAPPPPPTIEDTAAKADSEADALRRRQGRASTILSGTANASGGALAPANIGTKTLLG
jgi:hypothetical protein